MFKWSAPWVWYLLCCVTEQGGDIKKELHLCMFVVWGYQNFGKKQFWGSGLDIQKAQPCGVWYLQHFLQKQDRSVWYQQQQCCAPWQSSERWIARKTDLQSCFFNSPVQMPGVIYLLNQWPWEWSQWLLKWSFMCVKSNVLWDLWGRKFSTFLTSGWWKTINNNKCGAHHWNSKGFVCTGSGDGALLYKSCSREQFHPSNNNIITNVQLSVLMTAIKTAISPLLLL